LQQTKGGAHVKSIDVREFKLTISNFVNNSELPDEIKRMILREIYEEAEQKANLTIMEEIRERDRSDNAEGVKNAESAC